MKLIYPNIDKHIDFNQNKAYSLIIENSNEFYKLTNELYLQSNDPSLGSWVLSDNNRILDISKSMLMIYDYYNFDFNSKKIQTMISHEVESLAQANDLYYNISEINTLISNLNDTISNLSSIPIVSNYEFSLSDFIKLSSFKISTEYDFVNTLYSYIDIFQKLKNVSVVTFINLQSFLSQNEIGLLLKQLEYMDINTLMIDTHSKYTFDNVTPIIIDEDLCVI